ncbi:hypothetical protein ALC57_08535 [Trachymyrmex cornetzi]|uniref:Uncharacterized protein n=1 Tax=Trachymyrmex cornetzi TaxID=471704 RepID=A0A195E2R7_9HYME|nr:hypothetical protein ALC57_08535 [Trachymyrmex cornetzi]
MDEEGRKVIEGHLIAVDRTLIGLTRFSPCNAKLDVCCCGWLWSRTIVFLIRTHLVPPFVFHPIRKSCIINRVKSKCLTSIGSGESPLEGRKTKERTREAVGCERKNRVNGAKGCNVEEGESSCEFYANLIADTRERLETAENPGIVIARYTTVTTETFLVTHRNQRRPRQRDRTRAIPDTEISNRYYRDRSEEIKREWGKSFNHVATDRN